MPRLGWCYASFILITSSHPLGPDSEWERERVNALVTSEAPKMHIKIGHNNNNNKFSVGFTA